MIKKLKPVLLIIMVGVFSFVPLVVNAGSKFVEGSIDVNDTVLYLRADDTSPVVCYLDEGTRVGVYDEESGFVRIVFGNYRGYVKRNMLFVPSEDTYDATVYSNGLNVRRSPGLYATIIVQVKEDTPVEIVDVYQDWYQVKIKAEDCDSETDVTGFVAKEYVLVSQTNQPSTLLKLGMSGSRIKTLQKELKSRGFLYANATGYYGPATKQAIADFQVLAKLSPDGIAGEQTLEILYGDNNIKMVVSNTSSGSSSSSSSTGTSTVSVGGRIHFSTSSATSSALAKLGNVRKTDWGTINAAWPAYSSTATITVVATGQQFKVVRGNRTLHADVAPKTKADTAILLDIYGGRFRWSRCPIWITINGTTYAASMNGMPHGSEYITDNGFPGHICVHFPGSDNHNSGAPDPDHQAAINFAYAATKS